MEILGWIVWFFTFAFGLWSFIAFLYEVFWPSDGPEVLQVMYPFYLRRLIAGFEALGFISAAIVVILIQVSKFHLLWFAPVWYFWGLPRWFEWIYLYFNPELIDLIYPETDISWWFSILCPFSPSLVPDLIRKIHKSNKRNLLKYQSTIDCIANITMSSKEIEDWNERRIKGDQILAEMGVPPSPYSVMSEIKRTESVQNAIDRIEDITTLEYIFQMAEKAYRCVSFLWLLECGWLVYSSYRLMPKLIKKKANKRLSILKR